MRPFVFWIFLPILVLACFVVESHAAPPAPTGLRLLQQGPGPQRMAIRWDSAPDAVSYQVYLDGNGDGSTTSNGYVRELLLPDTTYLFEVSAVDSAGDESPRAQLEVTTLPIAPIPAVLKVNTILLKYADYPSEPFTAAEAESRIYGESGSVNSYFKEISYQQTEVTGNVYGWVTLPQNASHYHDRGQSDGWWWGLEASKVSDDAKTVVPAEAFNDVDAVIFFLHGTGDAGNSAGVYKYLSARRDWTNRIEAAVHELGHSLSRRGGLPSLGHPAGWLCPNADVGPSLQDPLAGGCEAWIYGYEPYDPLGAGNTRHFMSYHKWMMGMFAESNVADAVPGQIHDLEALETPGTGIKMLRIPVTKNEFFFAEYRTATGYDGVDLIPGSNSIGSAPIDGVLVRARVAATGLTLTTLLPNERTGAIVYGPGRPFLDPYRGNFLEVLEKSSGVAKVRVGTFNQPDLTIGTTPSRQLGLARFSAAGAGQSINANLRPKKSQRLHASAVNAGKSEEQFRLAGNRGVRGWSVQYFLTTPGRTNVSGQLYLGRGTTRALQSAEKQSIEIQLRAPAKRRRSCLVQMSGHSSAIDKAVDQVRVSAKS